MENIMEEKLISKKGASGEVFDLLRRALPVETKRSNSGGLVYKEVHGHGAGDLFSRGAYLPSGGAYQKSER